MRVGVNAIHLVPGETGGFEIYARRLLPALAAQPGLELVVLASPPAVRALADWGVPAEVVEVRVDARSRVRAVAAEQLVLPRLVRRVRPALLHSLFNTAPAAPLVPQVTTIHDVIYRRLPETHAGVLSWGLRVLVPLAARRSRRLIAVSQATKDDVVRFLPVPAERVDVVPNGPGSPPALERTPETELRRRLELGDRPVVLSLSAKRPHKNLERLIDA
ncbi:MAG: glycosyltransferase, partial [Actinomycetota bacterium]|nr:glycosyltransferase [Actinomycetota bacterium]